MSELPIGLAAEIAGGASCHVLCFRLTRSDGLVVGVTEHDRPLTIAGVDFEPGAALESARFLAGAGLAPDPASIQGAFSSEAIREDDLDAGLWHGARLDVFRADWLEGGTQSWGDVFLIWSGRLTGIERRGQAFNAELVSLKADLEAPLGRVISRQHGEESFWDAADKEDFRGFPDLIGNDALIAGDTARNGGSRRKPLA